MVRDLRSELKALMNMKDLSLRDLQRALGVSTGCLSQWMNGIYKGNEKKIEEFVRSFLERQRELMHTPRREFKFVMTSIALKVFEVARICHLDGDIGVVYGDAGLGKTEAVKEYVKQNPDVILIEVDLGHTSKALFSELHRMLGMEGFGTVHSMFEDVVEKLRDSGRLIIVDEAEHLPYKALELLRRVYDKAGVGILLSGMPRLISNLRGRRGEYAQLYSRVGIKARLTSLKPEDTKTIVQSLIPSVNGLSKVYHDTSYGNARTLSKLLARSLRVAELNKIEVTPAVIKETARMLII